MFDCSFEGGKQVPSAGVPGAFDKGAGSSCYFLIVKLSISIWWLYMSWIAARLRMNTMIEMS
jgi:hypothetical protein